jgi:hypothetical protein
MRNLHPVFHEIFDSWGKRIVPFDELSDQEKLIKLSAERAELLRDIRKHVHTSRSFGSHNKRIAKIDQQIRAIEQAGKM